MQKRTSIFCWIILSVFTITLCLATRSEGSSNTFSQGTPPSFAYLVKKAKDSVVNISTVKVIKGHRGIPFPFEGPFGKDDPFREFFERFFRDHMPKDFRQKSLGSGFIIDKKGYILTNNHVVEGTDKILVKLADETELDAEIVGRDPKTDLALIRIKTNHPLKPLPLGDSDKLQVGDWVIAIGNPFGLGHSVTAGIVSAKYRRIGAGAYDNFIQTDAPINPGNSGGPLLNMAGEVIGINTAIFTRSGGSIGIGFAIPINMAKELLPQLKEGKVVRGWLGVIIQKITPELREKLGLKEERGALVADVVKDGPAHKAGIKRGDVIISFDGKEIHNMNDLPYIVATTPVGKTVEVVVIRKGKKKKFLVEIGRMKEEGERLGSPAESMELGMLVKELTPSLARRFDIAEEEAALVVVSVEKGSPAEEAGLRPGDLILEVDQQTVKDLDAFNRLISKYKSGDVILFLVKRQGSTIYLTLKVWE